MRTIAITTGVLPAPPAITLPTTITGTPTRSVRSRPQAIEGTPKGGQRAVEQRERPQQPRQRAALQPGPLQTPRLASRLRGRLRGEGDLHEARRGAPPSITVITDWCAALASALMITTLSLPPPAAAASAAATVSTLRSGSAVLLIE